VRVLVDNPPAQLPTYFVLTHAFDHLDTCVLQDTNTVAVDPWIRVPHAENDSNDATLHNRNRARRRATVKRARLERRVQCGADDALTKSVGMAGGGYLRVVFAGAQRVATPQGLAFETHDHAADPGIISSDSPRKLRLFNRQMHPLFMIGRHGGKGSCVLHSRMARLGSEMPRRDPTTKPLAGAARRDAGSG
jgi:hypothetical protein